MPEQNQGGQRFVEAAVQTLQTHKQLAERATAQVSNEKMHQALDEHTNSIVVIMKHVAGNHISRWTDFLTSDGEKPWRQRDDEFVDTFNDRVELTSYWERGWRCLFESLASLSPDDLDRTVQIRGESHSVPLAIQRSLGHTTYHVGQIVQLARHHAGKEWTTLTIPRGGSEQYNRENWGERPTG